MQAVVLAGGKSSRFWPLNRRHKSLVKVGGRSLLEHTLEGLEEEAEDIVVVQGPERKAEKELEKEVRFVVQEEPLGMGHALEQAREHIDGRFIVTGPYRTDIGSLLESVIPISERYGSAVAATTTEHPERYGMLEMEGETGEGIVEKPERGEEPSNWKVVSTYILEEEFFEHLDRVERHQYSFEDALDNYMKDRDVGVARLDDEPLSLKYPWDLFDFFESMMEGMERKISPDAEIHESVEIDGKVVVEEGTKIYENAVLRGPCYVGEGSSIGNNAIVRSGTNLEAGAVVGSNSEVRGTLTQENFSCHASFIGDSLAGRNVSVGAGTVTANRKFYTEEEERPEVSVMVPSRGERVGTGRDRLGALLGDDVEIGTHSNIMPGVCIGSGTVVGPSTTVMENVEDEHRYYSKFDSIEVKRR